MCIYIKACKLYIYTEREREREREREIFVSTCIHMLNIDTHVHECNMLPVVVDLAVQYTVSTQTFYIRYDFWS